VLSSIEIEAKERVFGRHLVIVCGDECIPKRSLFDTNPTSGTRGFVVDIGVERPIGRVREACNA
jgi:hypothetical protein